MYSFLHPSALLLLFLIPLYQIALKTGFLNKMSLSLTLGDWNAEPFKWSSPTSSGARRFSTFCVYVGFILVVFSLASPVRFRQEAMYSGEGSAIVFVIDVSPSMAARDIGTATRLEAAISSIRTFVLKRPGDSVALVALGSEAALLVPPTTDHATFFSRLNALKIGEMGDGTALGLGLAVAAVHLIERESLNASVILFTDGENNAGEINPRTAAALFPSHSIDFFLVGIGSSGEVLIEYDDPLSGKHYSGTLDSYFDETELREIASRGGGLFVPVTGMDDLENLFAKIGDSVPVTPVSWSRTLEDSLEYPFLVTAVVFFIVAWFIRRLFLGALL